MEEEHQALVTESYLRLGLVEQRELAPVALVKEIDLDGLVTLSLPAQPTLMAPELCPGTSGSPWRRDSPGPSETAGAWELISKMDEGGGRLVTAKTRDRLTIPR